MANRQSTRFSSTAIPELCCGDYEYDCTTIQAAVTAATPFDTIKIGGGTYNENVNVKFNGLTIENVAGQQVTILGQGGYTGALGVATGVSGVTVKSSDGFRAIS